MERVTRWTGPEWGWFLARVLAVTVVLYPVFRLNEVGMAGLLDGGAPYWVAKILLDVLVLGYVTVRSRWTGPKLVASLFGLYLGLQAVSTVEIFLYGMITWSEVVSWVGGSLLEMAVGIVLVVGLFGGLRGSEQPVPDDRLRLAPVQWAWKLPVLAASFLVLMILAGLVVFGGIATVVDPVAYANYEILEPPSWILPFQLVRGLIFTGFLIPVIYLFAGGVGETRIAVAVLFAVLLSSNMLTGYAEVPGLLWVAHFWELFAQAFVYGLLAVTLLARPHHPLKWLGSRVSRRTNGRQAA